MNFRNLYDLASIILLLACIGTHVDDILDHTEYKARLHIRIMAITIIIISVRLLKSSRIIIPQFGTLVMILYYTISDMIIWFILYLVIWLSFSKSLELLFQAFYLKLLFLRLFLLDDLRWNEI